MTRQTAIEELGGASPLPVGVRCPECGYDLRGSTSDRCPECGFRTEVLRTRESLIPWSHRDQLGLFRAYWKTVLVACRHPRRFSYEMARPVSYADSQSFRWLTALHAYLPILIGSLIWCAFKAAYWGPLDDGIWWLLGSLQVWTMLMAALLPGLASYFFQAKKLSVEQQYRAVALSYYAWAPLAWTPLLLPIFCATLLAWGSRSNADLVLLSAVVALYCTILLLSTAITGRFMVLYLLPRGTTGMLRGMLLILCEVGLGLFLLLVPLSVFYLAVIISSLS
ncbi:MAG: hypothetical protein KAY37_15350 [Phycisphaerae bacterium]|nr:hypothetical protein [Phycisphaerae bacterium]